MFFNNAAATEIYTLSLHDALPILIARHLGRRCGLPVARPVKRVKDTGTQTHLHSRAQREANLDRKSTRLNSSHANISYAAFCLKKKNEPNRYYIFRIVLS